MPEPPSKAGSAPPLLFLTHVLSACTAGASVRVARKLNITKVLYRIIEKRKSLSLKNLHCWCCLLCVQHRDSHADARSDHSISPFDKVEVFDLHRSWVMSRRMSDYSCPLVQAQMRASWPSQTAVTCTQMREQVLWCSCSHKGSEI